MVAILETLKHAEWSTSSKILETMLESPKALCEFVGGSRNKGIIKSIYPELNVQPINKTFECEFIGGRTHIRAQLLLCISIPDSVASANRFSSCIVRWLLLCASITIDPTSGFTCEPKSVLVEKADAC